MASREPPQRFLEYDSEMPATEGLSNRFRWGLNKTGTFLLKRGKVRLQFFYVYVKINKGVLELIYEHTHSDYLTFDGSQVKWMNWCPWKASCLQWHEVIGELYLSCLIGIGAQPYSSILNCPVLIEAAVPQWLLLHPTRAVAATGVSLREEGAGPIPLRNALDPATELPKFLLAILPAESSLM